MKYLKSGMHFEPFAHLNSDAKFSLEILNLYLDFLRVTVNKVDSHTKVVPDIL